jgi:hypothetical protein
MNMALVLPILSSRLFSAKNYKTWFSTDCRASGDGASSTKSSANASKVSYNVARVNTCLLLPSTLYS